MSHFLVAEHRFAFIPRRLTIALLIKMSPQPTLSPLHDAYMAPDRDIDKSNPMYQLKKGAVDALKESYQKAKHALRESLFNSMYNLKPVLNPAYAENNRGNSYNASDIGRAELCADKYKFRLCQP